MPNLIRSVIVMIFLITGSMPGCNRNEAGKEQRQLFDLNWEFHEGDIASLKYGGFENPGWQDLDLPHEWICNEVTAPDNSSALPDTRIPEVGWYRKEFNIPADWQKKRVSVYFEGVEDNPEVFINGSSLGLQPSGTSSFYSDITPFLDYTAENIISVRVNNPGHSENPARQQSGIYSHVWLILTDTAGKGTD